MFNILIILKLFLLIAIVDAKYNGPFMFWGRIDLNNLDSSSLNDLDENVLHKIYAESPAIILFVRNTSSRINEEDFPMFKDILQQTNHLYSTQHQLPLDPVDFNLNADVINLVGPTSQQDVELSALYRDAVLTNGDGNVLGILATKANEERMKREANDNQISISTTSATEPIINSDSNSIENDQKSKFVYYSDTPYKILLQTDRAPRLFNGSFRNILESPHIITSDQRNSNVKLKVTDSKNADSEGLSISFVFNIATSGYWSLVGAEIGININTTYLTSVDKPSAPLGFSYKCSKPMIFRNGSLFLELANIQVQPNITSKRFSEAYDCVGFTSAPIWSGIFVSAIICLVVAIGINCLMEIKAPNRFENSRGKQLTFTIQE